MVLQDVGEFEKTSECETSPIKREEKLKKLKASPAKIFDDDLAALHMFNTKHLTLVVLICTYLFALWGNYDKVHPLTLPSPSRAEHKNQTPYVGIKINQEIFMMNDTEINDFSHHASSTASKMALANPHTVYTLNETIKVKIVLFDHKNRPKTRGGDMLIVWMRDKSKGAALAGSVIDHDNGTYTGTLRILWTGHAVIRAAILCTREKMAFMQRELRNGYAGKKITCLFHAPNLAEITSGHMDHTFLKTGQVCNLTDKHYGVPLYCDKPKKNGIQCRHWTGINSVPWLKMTLKPKSKWYLKSFVPGTFPGNVTVHIPSAPKTAMASNIPCSRTNFRNTWLSNPAGFFFNSTWRPLSCFNNITVKHFDRCLANRTLRMFGDSTVRQFFIVLFKYQNLTWRIGPKGTESNFIPTSKWYSYSEAYSKRFNYTVSWSPHGLPMSFENANRTEIRPCFVHLDEIPSGSRDIVLINLYAHFQLFPVHMFKTRMRLIRLAIERLLLRSPDIKIAIKGSHYFIKHSTGNTLGGLWGPVYDKIIKQEFVALYDRVVFLDLWDMLVSVENSDIHPPEQFIKTMLRTLFGYVCT
ncbi:NXPE family member 3-like [Haliotis asinina]|uniref:NXPE family member 3-like n=1 Tax=Haliotis asinina TaxID=109174 RepID=UPI003531D01D